MRIEGPGRPLVQVQIVTYNSESHIGRCLQSLAKQTAVIDRVLVIDNASTDGTTAIVRAQMSRSCKWSETWVTPQDTIKDSEGQLSMAWTLLSRLIRMSN